MNYNIRGENIEVTPALKDHVERKIGKLERYFDHSVDADVNVNLRSIALYISSLCTSDRSARSVIGIVTSTLDSLSL